MERGIFSGSVRIGFDDYRLNCCALSRICPPDDMTRQSVAGGGVNGLLRVSSESKAED